MIPSVVDVSGLNRITRTVFTRAAGAICGMVEAKLDSTTGKPLIVASMFGNTTTCVNTAKEVLEQAGYEVLVFHATGAGGQAMESLIESGSHHYRMGRRSNWRGSLRRSHTHGRDEQSQGPCRHCTWLCRHGQLR
jgi:hypothetical protein